MTVSGPDEESGSSAVQEPSRIERPPPRASDIVLIFVAGATAIIVTLVATAALLAGDDRSGSGWWAAIAASGFLALSALGLGGVLLSRRRAFLGETRLLLMKLDEAASINVSRPDLEQEAIDRRDALIISGDLAQAERLTEALRRAGTTGPLAARPRRGRPNAPDWADEE